MKKQKKILIQLIVFFTIILSNCQVFAAEIIDYVGKMKFSDAYLEYLELEDEAKANVIAPRMYEIPKINKKVFNPLKIARMLERSSNTSYSLQTIIPENMVVKNQMNTGTCYAFSSLAALESTLALKDYKNKVTPVVYDFSERHMEYATSQTFKNGVLNENGHAREVGDGGVQGVPVAYLTNGTGAIAEEALPFENNEDKIDISNIQGKNVVTKVNDTLDFPSYSVNEDTTQIKQQMKEYIMNYGAIDAGIHGASIIGADCYNNQNGALYCATKGNDHPINHAVIIVGWDDNYSAENFAQDIEGDETGTSTTKIPENNGAWIIRNSWGMEDRYTVEEMKQIIFEQLPNYCEQNGWSDATQIPNEVAERVLIGEGYAIEGDDEWVRKIGKNGFMYVSYEDVNIYQDLTGIQDAQTEITYENIYQYDYYGSFLPIEFTVPKMYLATVFDKKTSGLEYLTEVGINASETYTCKVYVNPNGIGKSFDGDLVPVKLKGGNGETETFDAGYHTIEFAEPIKINGSSFVVVLEIVSAREDGVSAMMEFNFGEFFATEEYDDVIYHCYDNVKVEKAKCFFSNDNMLRTNQWADTSTMFTLTQGGWPNFDTTIKAFTTSKVLESIEITTPPTKVEYVEGQDFDATGMVVKAKYTNGDIEEITDYNILEGTDVVVGQTSVTILYKGKIVKQPITVTENTVENITITTPPTTIEYWAGDDFDKSGMIVNATYKDGTTKEITDYKIEDGKNLKNGQTTVTISYDGKTVTQAITVKANPVVKIEITQQPKKVNYIVGQNFDTEGMIVTATYESGTVKEVEDYVVQNGENLQKNQTTVTISYEGKTVTQAITVLEKQIVSIKVKTIPTKTEYFQNSDELDLTGGIIEILYNDDSKEDIQMTSKEITVSGFDNKKIGKQTITLTYNDKITQFDIQVKEKAQPENSKFDNIKLNVKNIKAYYFTAVDKNEYITFNVELDNIIQAKVNDDMEYYYYLSANSQETNITNWIKIDNIQENANKISFEINTLDIANYEELVTADAIYLYVKELAIRNEIKKEAITTALSITIENMTIEEYVDGVKKQEVNSNEIIGAEPADKKDPTAAPGTIPNAGKGALMIGLILIIFIVGRIAYFRYKDIQIK